MKSVLIILFYCIISYAQCEDNIVYYKFFNDSIEVNFGKWEIFDPHSSLIVKQILTSTEMLGIKYYERMRERGLRFIGGEIDEKFNKQVYKIWGKQKKDCC